MVDSAQFSPLSIAVLNRLVRERLETGFPLCWVTGEISNLTQAASGHAYFTLKDESAQVRCVMFRNRNALLGWRLANGQHVEARVLVTLYEARGDFQLNVETMRQAGVGNLFERFQKLKAKLEAEGLFAPEIKRPLPAFPHRIGIVTSPQAAALRDVLTTLARRSPQVEVVLFPTPVQGEGAGLQIAAAIEAAGSSGLCETLIVCRGGGSIEDLWAFNEEIVARAIRACPIPVVSGVGHETDFTIADFAADLRAPTPTAAAEVAAPECERLRKRVADLHKFLQRALTQTIEQRLQRVDWLAQRLTHPAERLNRQRETLVHLGQRLAAAALRQQTGSASRLATLQQRLIRARPGTENAGRRVDHLGGRLNYAWQAQAAMRTGKLARLSDSLQHLNPQAVLGRGYAVVRDSSGRIVREAAGMEPSTEIHVYLAHGRLDASVTAADNDDQLIPAPAGLDRRNV
jgi:exodeoxyribonuclease VII large subunit